jgi:SAM-dependent methyltransferase
VTAHLPDPPPNLYGDRIADVYDAESFLRHDDATEAVEFLAPFARKGRALELGIGTGRIAVPLAARGVKVEGVDASERMVERLRAKPGGAAIPVRIGDFGDLDIEGRFSLVFVVFNTFFGLLSQEAQVRCFERVAKRLDDGGVFVIEAFVPSPERFDRGQRTDTTKIAEAYFDVTCNVHDAARQRVDSRHIRFRDDGRYDVYPVNIRYAWPSELDLMARLAGLRLRERFAGWDRRPFTTASGSHVSVYERSR